MKTPLLQAATRNPDPEPSAKSSDFNLRRVPFGVEFEADFFNRIGRLLLLTTNSNSQISSDHGHEACWSKCNQMVKWWAISHTAKL